MGTAATGEAQPSTPEGQQLSPVAAAATSAESSREAGSDLTIYLLTMGPGDEVWEKFGHNAIWIHDETNRTDIAYHWGLFDFADREFFPRFIQGRMRYSMGAFDFEQTIDAYRQANRTVWAQRLNLTPAQRQELAQFIAWNVRPENRYYRYDYFRDNCSTRVRDALDGALGGIIRQGSHTVPSHTSYRFHTERLTQDDWPVFTGTLMALGEPVDRPISAYEEMFLPVRMMERFRSLNVAGPGGPIPLVADEQVVFQATRPAEAARVERGVLGYLVIACVVLLCGGLLFFAGGNRGLTGPLVLGTVWSFVAGISGLLLAGLWGFTDHLYSYRNENVLQLNPVSLLVFAALIQFLWSRRKQPTLPPSRFLLLSGAAALAFSVLGFVMQALPSLDQVNGGVIGLALPLHAGLIVVLLAARALAANGHGGRP